MTERETTELRNALNRTLNLLESTVAWAEARGFTDSQEYINFENRANQLTVKDHNINFANYKYMD